MTKKLTIDEIERGLTDKDGEVRQRFAERTDFTPTPAQIERGLTDKRCGIRVAWINRTDFTPTPAQIERALTDKEPVVRGTMFVRNDFTPTPAQIERALKDGERYVQFKVNIRFFSDEWQIQRAQWEANELKKRHANVVRTKPKAEAL